MKLTHREFEWTYRKYVNIPEAQIYIQKKDLFSMTMVVWEGIIGLVFCIKYNKPFHYDSFRGQPDKVLLNQLPKQIVYQIYIIQSKNSKLCGSYFLYSIYSIEKMKFYDVNFGMFLGFLYMPIYLETIQAILKTKLVLA